jgi:hypothetical protein
MKKGLIEISHSKNTLDEIQYGRRSGSGRSRQLTDSILCPTLIKSSMTNLGVPVLDVQSTVRGMGQDTRKLDMKSVEQSNELNPRIGLDKVF